MRKHKRAKKFSAPALMFALLLSLCACGSGEGEMNSLTLDELSLEESGSHHYERLPLPGDMLLSVSQYADGGVIYLCGMDAAERPLFYSFDGEDYASYVLPEGIDYVQVCCRAEGKMALVAGERPASWTDANGNARYNEHPEEPYQVFLLIYDENGELLSQTPLDQSLRDGRNFRSLRFLQGCFYLMSDVELAQLDSQGGFIQAIGLQDGLFTAQAVTGQGLAVAYIGRAEEHGDYGDIVDLLRDSEAFAFENLLPPEERELNGLGSDSQGELLLCLEDSVLRFPKKGEPELICGDIRDYELLVCPELYAFSGGYLLSRPDKGELSILAPGPAAERSEELIIWTDTGVGENLLSLAADLNRAGLGFKVKVEQVQDMDEAALRAAIISGQGPDIYYLSSWSSFYDLSGEAVFEDLLPLLPEGSLVPCAQSAAMTGDRLYYLPLCIDIYLLQCTREDLAPPGLSLGEMAQLPQVLSGEMSLFRRDAERKYYWETLSSMYLGEHLDLGTASCDFTDPEYSELLSFCAGTLPTGEMNSLPFLLSPERIEIFSRMLFLQERYGDNWYFIQDYGTAVTFWDAFAISSTSENKADAWAFLEFALSYSFTEAGERPAELPASQKIIDSYIENAQSVGLWDTETEEFVTLTEHSASQLRAMLETPARLSGQPEGLLAIMTEEAEKVFAGDKTPEEAAALTQSRADIFLAERYR